MALRAQLCDQVFGDAPHGVALMEQCHGLLVLRRIKSTPLYQCLCTPGFRKVVTL
jgi:hypothetical protein